MGSELSTETFTVSHSRRMLIFAARALILIGGFLVTTRLMWPYLSGAGSIVGLIACGLMAVLFLAVELVVSAKLQRRKPKELAIYRALYFDWLLAGEDSVASKKQREVMEDQELVKVGEDSSTHEGEYAGRQEWEKEVAMSFEDMNADDPADEIVIDAEVVE